MTRKQLLEWVRSMDSGMPAGMPRPDFTIICTDVVGHLAIASTSEKDGHDDPIPAIIYAYHAVK